MSEPNKISAFLPYLLAAAGFMQMLDATILNTALPTIANDLSVSPLRMQLVIISYALTMALLMPLSGFVADRFGTQRVFVVSLFLFALGSLCCALAQNLSFLIFSRIIQGSGGAMLLPMQRLVLLRAYSKDQLLEKLNLVVIPALLGPVLGPVIGGCITEYASWHWVFLLNLPIAACGIVLSCKFMPNFRPEELNRFDFQGFVLFASSVLLLSLGAELAVRPQKMLMAAVFVVLGILFFILYIYHARRASVVLYPLELIKIRSYRIGLIGNLCTRLGMSSVPFLLPLMLQVGFDYSPSESGFVLLFLALGSISAKSFVPKLLNYFGYRRFLIWNTRVLGLGIFAFGFLRENTYIFLIIALIFALGILNSLQFSAMNTISMCRLRTQYMSAGSSLLVVNQQLAMTFAIALSAILLNFFHGLEIETKQCFYLCFWGLGVLSLFSSNIFARLHPWDGRELLRQNPEPMVVEN